MQILPSRLFGLIAIGTGFIFSGSMELLAQNENAAASEAPLIVKVIESETVDPTQTRSFPSVLEPPQITPLAFDVGGRLGEVDLQIGQAVEEGELLLNVEATDFNIQLEQSEAQLAEAQATYDNAKEEADRQQQLFERNVSSEAARDSAATALQQAEARLEQAQRSVDLVRESRDDTALRAPFKGFVNSIDVQNFENVSPGQAVVTLYQDGGLQAEILVSFQIVSQLKLGDQVMIRPSDERNKVLSATITEIAQRAPAVSAFPVIVTLDETAPELRSGMAVEVAIELPAAEGLEGILLPMSVMAAQLMTEFKPVEIEGLSEAETPRRMMILIVNQETNRLEEREVIVGGISGGEILVIDGLSGGELVVSAGVTFLRPGQLVEIWEG